MLDTISLNYTSNSNSQKVSLLPTSANQYFVVSPFDQYDILDWSHLLGASILQFKMQQLLKSESYQTMLASESVLRADWDSPEEDEAWADL